MKPDGVFVMGDMVTEDDSFHAPVIVPHNGFDVDEIMQVAKTQEFKYVKAYVHDSMCKNERDYPLFIFIAFKN